MTTKTTNLKLTTYNAALDSGSLVYNYINDVSGSNVGQNLYIIDQFAGQVSGSLAGLSASIVTLNSQMLFATAPQVSTGSASNLIVSPSALAMSEYGKRSVNITINTSASLLGGEMGFIRVPPNLSGWYITGMGVSCGGSSTSGSPSFSLYKYPYNANPMIESSGSNLLSSSAVINQGAFEGSGTIITGSSAKVFTTEKVRVKCTVSGSQCTYAQAVIVFQNKPLA